MINIFIVDDHPVVISGIEAIFKDGIDKIKITGSATSAEEALPLLKRFRGKLVLLDLVMPIKSGVEFCAEIKTLFPKLKVIILTGELDTTLLNNVWLNGADAIVTKYCGKQELIETINGVLSGRRIIGSKVPDFSNNALYDYSVYPRLTDSEQKVLNLLAKGDSRGQVSKVLDISLNAVNFHCKNIFKKFNKKKLVQVLEEARKAKFIK